MHLALTPCLPLVAPYPRQLEPFYFVWSPGNLILERINPGNGLFSCLIPYLTFALTSKALAGLALVKCMVCGTIEPGMSWMVSEGNWLWGPSALDRGGEGEVDSVIEP